MLANIALMDLTTKRKKQMTFAEDIKQGIPDILPEAKAYDPAINHAPIRKDILTPKEKKLAIENALR